VFFKKLFHQILEPFSSFLVPSISTPFIVQPQQLVKFSSSVSYENLPRAVFAITLLLPVTWAWLPPSALCSQLPSVFSPLLYAKRSRVDQLHVLVVVLVMCFNCYRYYCIYFISDRQKCLI